MDITGSIPLSLGQTLGALMTAVIEAQAQAARATVEFIEDVGTVAGSGASDPVHELRNVNFKYRKLDEEFETKEFLIEIPLLSMVDIPLITVKGAVFSFNYEISKTSTREVTTPPSTGPVAAPVVGAGALPFRVPEPALITGRFRKAPPPSSSQPSQAKETGGLDVTIELEKAPLPVGVDRILDILELAATESKVPDPE